MIEGQQVTTEGGAGGATPGSPPSGGVDAAGPRAVRLGGLLQDLLAARGRLRTSELLGVSERTLQRAEAEGRLTEQLCRALERYEAGLLESSTAAGSRVSRDARESGVQPVDAVDNRRELLRLTRRVDRLDERVQALHDEPPEVQATLALLHRLETSVDELQQQVAALQSVKGGDAAGLAVSAGASVRARSASLTRSTKSTAGRAGTPLRRYPELVTEEAVPGESRVYGAARSVIVEWRQTRKRRERASTTLERLRADERLLELELMLVGEHGLTLPPADRPWDGIRRQSELRVLDQALGRVRRERRRAQLRHWGLRLLTFGLWGLWGLLARRRSRRLRR